MTFANNYDLLVQKSKVGDNAAWTALYELLYKHVYAYALQKIKNEQTAEDLVQEGFLVVLKLKDKLNAFEDVRKMLFTVVKRRCLDHKKAKRIQTNFIDNLYGILFPYEPTLNTAHKKFELQNIVAALPPKSRRVIELSYTHGFTLKQIASIMKLSPGRVQALRKNTTLRLRRELS